MPRAQSLRRMRWFLVVALAMVVGGACQQSTVPSSLDLDVTLDSRVSDPTGEPVSGAIVELKSESGQAIASSATGLTGVFEIQIRAKRGDRLSISVAKDQFETQSRLIEIAGVVRQSPGFWTLLPARPLTLAGRYRLTFVVAASCPTFPSGFSSREYDATWEVAPGQSFGRITVGGRFLDSVNYVETRSGVDTVRIVARRLQDFEDNPIAELVGDRGYFAIGGASTVSGVVSGQAEMQATFAGPVEYCDQAVEGRAGLECAVPAVQCNSTEHQLRLVRQ